MTDLIVNAGVKETLDEYTVAADFYDALDVEVRELIADQRSGRANDRKTVQPRDL